MAYVPATSTRVLLGSYGLSANLTSIDAGPTVAMLDTTTIVDAAETFIPGSKNEMFSLQGWLDPTGTSNLQFDQLKTWTELGAGKPLTVAPRGLAASSEVFMANALAAKLDIGTPVGGVVNFKMDAQQDGAVDLGKMLTTTVPTTSSTNETSNDNSAASSNGLVAHLHVVAYSGLTNVVVKVQSSTDNVTFGTDVITFSTVTGLTYQRSSVTGSVARYLRVSSTVTGTGSITYYVAVARR